MIRPSLFVGAAVLAIFAIAACSQKSSAPVDIRATMQGQVNPAMMEIWDIGNNALGDDGTFDGKLMDNAKWTTVAENADKLAAAGKAISEAGSFVAAAADNSTVGEGEITMAAVQGHIDGNPDGLKQHGASFADSATRLAAAARAKDAKAAGDLISGMDRVCENCHLDYWYPEQKALVEETNH